MVFPLKNDSLACSLYYAANAISEVSDGVALPQALARIFQAEHFPSSTHGAIQDISYQSMRSKGITDQLLIQLANKPVQPMFLHSLLSCALTLLLQPVNRARYDDFTVVNQAVEACDANRKIAGAKGLVNAILRRFLRERDILILVAQKTPHGKWNYPTWWIDRLKAAYPEQWEKILETGNKQPPLTLRVNQRRISVENYLGLLEKNDIHATQIGPVAVRLRTPMPVHQIPGFEDGLVSVQDAAAQLAVPLLDVKDGMRVLDACAAPGGKTCHLLELADIELQAIDHDPARLTRIQENLDRLGLTAQLSVGDARFGQDKSIVAEHNWWDGRLYDRILADVPCTASGIVRRHPDIRWLRRKMDSSQLAQLSAQILDNLWNKLAVNGKLLLVTCSVWPDESEKQAEQFAAKHNAKRLPAPGQLLPTTNDHEDHDGLFFALFEKTES